MNASTNFSQSLEIKSNYHAFSEEIPKNQIAQNEKNVIIHHRHPSYTDIENYLNPDSSSAITREKKEAIIKVIEECKKNLRASLGDQTCDSLKGRIALECEDDERILALLQDKPVE